MHLQICTFPPEKSLPVPWGTPGLLLTPPHFTLCPCHLIKSGKSCPYLELAASVFLACLPVSRASLLLDLIPQKATYLELAWLTLMSALSSFCHDSSFVATGLSFGVALFPGWYGQHHTGQLYTVILWCGFVVQVNFIYIYFVLVWSWGPNPGSYTW